MQQAADIGLVQNTGTVQISFAQGDTFVARVVALQTQAKPADPQPACAVQHQVRDIISRQASRPTHIVLQVSQQLSTLEVKNLDATGASDPYCVVRCFGKTGHGSVIKGSFAG